MKITTNRSFNLAYTLLPFKRNQDVVQIHKFDQGVYCIAVTDGWNSPEVFSDDEPGREVARIVANQYPKIFFSSKIRHPSQRAKEASKKIDERITKKYPRLATAVAVFLFHFDKEDIIVSVGDVETYLWNGDEWYKPKEISSHELDRKIYESNVARFFGAHEHKIDPRFPGIFSAEPDVMIIPSNTPVLIATDDIKDVLTIEDVNLITQSVTEKTPKNILVALLKEIQRRKTQNDDISILIRFIRSFVALD